MRNIVFAVTNDLSYDRRMHRICSSLAARYRVTLTGRLLNNSQPLDDQPFTQRRVRCWFNTSVLFYAEYNLRLFWYLLRCDADIFGACDLDTVLAVRCAAALRRRRTVFDAHEYYEETPEVERRPLVQAVWRTIGRWCIPRFTLRYTVGDALAEVLTGLYRVPFGVIRNVPPLQEEPLLPCALRERTIVYHGALNEGRGLEYAIRAMEHLKDYRLILIGEGELSQRLRTMAAKRNVLDRVVFRGFMLPENLHETNTHALIGLNLLEARSKSYYLSLANKFFDYIQAGVVSVNMDFPEYRKLIAEFPVGVLITELSVDALVNTIRRLVDDTARMDAMIGTCTVARHTLCWEREEGRLMAMYERAFPSPAAETEPAT